MPFLLTIAAFPALAVAFGVAWWKIWKHRPSARGWGIAASLAFILLFLTDCLYGFHCWRALYGSTLLFLAIGIAGLVVFSRKNETESGTGDSAPMNNPS
jgi:hypothetical protein